MKLLFVHQNFPAQYLHVARHFGANSRNEIVFITQRPGAALPGVRNIVYKPQRQGSPHTHHYLRSTEAGVLNAQAVARVALELKKSGFVPDLMIGHNGWGEIWYLKDVFPDTPLLGYFEFFYRAQGADVGFDPAEAPQFDRWPRLRTKNLGNLLGLDAADWGQCPTRWQKSTYPAAYQSKLQLCHEGIDTRTVVADAKARLSIPERALEFAAGDEIVTYVARNLEPYRGFPSLMRSLPKILARRPQAQILIVGGDDVSYGARLPDGKTYRQKMLDELGDAIDTRRVHFLGKLPYAIYLKVLQVSRVHVYLTYPFVLSWSMLEAMSAECLIVGSRTAPVTEIIRDGENGLLVDFFEPPAIAERVIAALESPDAFSALRNAARQTVIANYDLATICLPAHVRLVETLAAKR